MRSLQVGSALEQRGAKLQPDGSAARSGGAPGIVISLVPGSASSWGCQSRSKVSAARPRSSAAMPPTVRDDVRGNRLAKREDGAGRGDRLLKNHRGAAPPQIFDMLRRGAVHLPPAEKNLPADF